MKATSKKRKQIHRTAAQWRELVAAWRASGRTNEAWAHENGVSFESLRRWNKRLRQSPGNSVLVELARKTIPAIPEATMRVTVTREGGLELSGAFSEDILRTLIRLLREPIDVR
jgi:hypothetical protein